MTVIISKTVDIENILDVLEGEFNSYNPQSHFETAIREKRIFIAKSGNQSVGFLMHYVWWGNTPFIELIKVHPKFQRQNVGTALLKAAAKEIFDLGHKQLISSTEIINSLGLNFHRKMGFKPLAVLDLPHGQEEFYKLDIAALLTP